MKISYLEATLEELAALWLAGKSHEFTKANEEVKSWKYYTDVNKNKVIFKLNVDKKSVKADKVIEKISEKSKEIVTDANSSGLVSTETMI